VKVLLINILFVTLLFVHPQSELHDMYNMPTSEVIHHYANFINIDTGTYTNLQPDGLRTIGYPFILATFMRLPHFIVWMMLFNCLLGAWLFHVTFKLIGSKAWILAGLGAFTAYVPILYTDLLFAAIFVTSIWQIKRLWLHFLLLGLAALVRPSLAWFFLIEPFVLYFNGYSKKLSLLSLPIVFVLTSFNPIRNKVNIGKWTHSTVLEYNMTSPDYYTGPKYFVKSFKANFLSGHYATIGGVFGKYKRDKGNKTESILLFYLNIVCVMINLAIWIRFGIRVLQRRVNWGYVIMAAYFVFPTLFGAAGARLRLPIEWILLI